MCVLLNLLHSDWNCNIILHIDHYFVEFYVYASAYVLFIHIIKYWSQIYYASLGLIFTTISIMNLPIYSHSGLYSSTNWIMHDSNDSKELCHLLYGQPDWFFSADKLLLLYCTVFTTSAQSPATGASATHDVIPVSLMVVFASVLYSDLSKFALLSSCSYFVLSLCSICCMPLAIWLMHIISLLML